MIKYVTYEAFDEYGQHIVPINTELELTKTASHSYSPEIENVIANMQRNPELYYVVINALGSYEAWGVNGNGDAFPREALSHLSLRSDLGTPNDYGYKTFEYYAKLFKHHVNKPDSPSYGEVIFSHWNPAMERVELIVGINRFKGKDLVDALESGNNVAVSMGAKVPWDECNICGNRAKTRAQYCKHAKNYLRQIIDEDLAKQWSRELGKEILPGTKVHVINRKPRFFDISKVTIGADRTAFVLGKVASDMGDFISSIDLADAIGVTDEMFDKVAEQAFEYSPFEKKALFNKKAIMDKRFGGTGEGDVDGRVAALSKANLIAKALKEKMNRVIEDEPEIPNGILDHMSERHSVGDITKTMLAGGVFPKPKEFQRIVLVRAGHRDLANELDRRGMIFNHKQCEEETPMNGGIQSDLIPSLRGIMSSRSFFPGFLKPRMVKIQITAVAPGGPGMRLDMLNPISNLYGGLKKEATHLRGEDFLNVRPAILGMYGKHATRRFKLIKTIDDIVPEINRIPAKNFKGVIADTNFSGKIKFGLNKVSEEIIDEMVLPMAYLDTAVDQEYINTMEKTAELNWMSYESDLTPYIARAMDDIKNVL